MEIRGWFIKRGDSKMGKCRLYGSQLTWKQIAWLIQKCNVEMDREWIRGVYSLLVSVLLDSVLSIYLSVVDMFYLFTSETLRQYNSLLWNMLPWGPYICCL